MHHNYRRNYIASYNFFSRYLCKGSYSRAKRFWKRFSTRTRRRQALRMTGWQGHPQWKRDILWRIF